MQLDLSVITPVYNCATYLESGFKNLKPLYDSEISFEIIYVNDGSTDSSLKVLRQIEKGNKNVRVFTQDNQGSSGARNTAIDIAKGDYIQFLDADDNLDINKILKLLNIANEKTLDLIGYRLDYVNDKNQQIGVRAKHPIPYNQLMSGPDALIKGYQPSSICIFLFRRQLLIENNLRIYPRITHMDVEFMTRVMINVKSVIFKDVICYHYLQRDGSITKPKTKQKLEKLNFDEVIIAGLIKDNILKYKIKDIHLVKAIKQNYNNVVWNLLWKFVSKSYLFDYEFKKKCIKELHSANLFPIRGPLKTKFQKITKIPLNLWFKSKFFNI